MTDLSPATSADDRGSLSAQLRREDVLDAFESAWRAGQRPDLNAFLCSAPEASRPPLFCELLSLELGYRREAGETPQVSDYIAKFPQFAEQVRQCVATAAAPKPRAAASLKIRCPHCHNPIDVVDDDPSGDVSCPSCGSCFNLAKDSETARYLDSGRMLGQFQLLNRLGQGAFGEVWKARDTELDRIIAIKIPRREYLTEEEGEKFLREARAAAQVRHPNIVSVHEVGREAGQIYIASEFIDGATLDQWVEAHPLTVRESVELCAKIAEALHHAHEAGVVHRDIKPQNILVRKTDGGGSMVDGQTSSSSQPSTLNIQPFITDFGLAKRDAGEITMTVEGAILGTPAYMSPEQARGEAHHADRRSDVYSLGVILFRLLTGELPFRGQRQMLIVQILNEEPPALRKLDARLPRDVETICLKCLEKDPASRYQSAAALAADLRRWLTGHPIEARPVSRTERAWRWCHRNPIVAALTLTTVSALFLGAIISNHFAATANAAREREVNQEALGTLQFVCAKPIGRDELLQKIRNEPAISDAARQRALELAETYWQWEEQQWITAVSYLTAERKQRNLLRNGSFEDQLDSQVWFSKSWRHNPQAVAIESDVAHEGNYCVLFLAEYADHLTLEQTVAVKPNTDYLLCGWIKTEGVSLKQEGNIGATLTVVGDMNSPSVFADKDWTYVALKFNSGQRSNVVVSASLGFFGSICTGKAWFDDLCLIPLDHPPTRSQFRFEDKRAPQNRGVSSSQRVVVRSGDIPQQDSSTPEMQVEREALSLLRTLCTKPIEKETLIQKLRGDKTISDVARQRAIELAVTYWHRKELQWANLPNNDERMSSTINDLAGTPDIAAKHDSAALFSPPMRLKFEDTPLENAVRLLSKASNVPIELRALGQPDGQPRPRITADLSQATFWESLDQICQQASLINIPSSSTALMLQSGKVEQKFVLRSGSIRMRLQSVSHNRALALNSGTSDPQETLSLQFEVQAVPEDSLIGLRSATFTQIQDSNDISRLANSQTWTTNSWTPSLQPANVVTQINLTQSPSKSLRVVRGILPFVIATESHERFQIEDIKSSVGKISQDDRGAFVQITSHNLASDFLTLRVATSQGGVPADGNTLQIQFFDRQGKRVMPAYRQEYRSVEKIEGLESDKSSDQPHLVSAFSFGPKTQVELPSVLVVSTVKTKDHLIPFEFNDVPVP